MPIYTVRLIGREEVAAGTMGFILKSQQGFYIKQGSLQTLRSSIRPKPMLKATYADFLWQVLRMKKTWKSQHVCVIPHLSGS